MLFEASGVDPKGGGEPQVSRQGSKMTAICVKTHSDIFFPPVVSNILKLISKYFC